MKGTKNKEIEDIYDSKMPLKNINNYNIDYNKEINQQPVNI